MKSHSPHPLWPLRLGQRPRPHRLPREVPCRPIVGAPLGHALPELERPHSVPQPSPHLRHEPLPLAVLGGNDFAGGVGRLLGHRAFSVVESSEERIYINMNHIPRQCKSTFHLLCQELLCHVPAPRRECCPGPPSLEDQLVHFKPDRVGPRRLRCQGGTVRGSLSLSGDARFPLGR